MAREKLFDYQGSDKHKLRIADLLNITDVISDGVTMADSEGVVDLSILSSLQEQIDTIMRYLDINIFYTDENNEFYLDENGMRYSDV